MNNPLLPVIVFLVLWSIVGYLIRLMERYKINKALDDLGTIIKGNNDD